MRAQDVARDGQAQPRAARLAVAAALQAIERLEHALQLFRRDAGAFAAYLVDAETGELRERLSDGQREHDLEIARVNIAGELMDLEAGGLLQEDRDPVAVSERIMTRYRELWGELTGPELIDDGERWRVEDRMRRLNALGFDVDELEITTDLDGTSIRVPTPNVSVVDFKFVAKKATTVEEINEAIKAASNGALKGILGYTDEPLVSRDFNHDSHSSIFATDQTKVMEGNFVRILTWYDNEWGFSNRMSDTAVALFKTF